jgi:hypothetical protein
MLFQVARKSETLMQQDCYGNRMDWKTLFYKAAITTSLSNMTKVDKRNDLWEAIWKTGISTQKSEATMPTSSATSERVTSGLHQFCMVKYDEANLATVEHVRGVRLNHPCMFQCITHSAA